jgi:4-amino-4-deoxy-L-arabinose transferase-like glycosyltransferase
MLRSTFMSKSPAPRPGRKPTAPTPEAPPPAPAAWLPWLERHARLVALAAVLLATARIAATYHVFSHTFDEPTHIATGMEWLDRKSYTWEPQHPPLARVAAALGPFLLGHHTHKLPNPASQDPADNKEHEGLAVLYEKHEYEKTLTAARLGILPFFWIACAVVWAWGRRYYGATTGALAVAIFTFLPPVLAHAGLATTDMALTAFVGAAFLTGMIWLEQPTPRRALLFGLSTALAVVSKFSSLAFLPAAAIVAAFGWLAFARRQPVPPGRVRALLPSLGIAVLTACVVIWGAYRFSFHGVPAPELFQGIGDVMRHNREGHLSYFFGELSTTGWWYFFPVMLGLKTPLAALALAALWAAIPPLRARWRSILIPLGFSLAILLVGMAANINIGIRHILPIYLGLSLIAAAAIVEVARELWQRKWAAPLVSILAVWFAGASLLAHPDYLPYFNELALGQPEKIAVDSDLEWGQDLKRLATRLRQLQAPAVTLLTEVVADFAEQGLPPVSRNMDGYRPSAGWTSTDATYWKERRMGLGLQGASVTLWLDRIPPQEKVGAGYYLWYFPPAQ